MQNRGGFPTFPAGAGALPPGPYPAGSVLVSDGTQLQAQVLLVPELKAFRARFYAFSGWPVQWLYMVDAGPVYNMVADASTALRIPWTPGCSVGGWEVAIPNADVQTDEAFTVRLYGIIDDGTNILGNYTPAPLDGSPAITMPDGTFETQRDMTRRPATIGGIPVTHLLVRFQTSTGAFYTSDINVTIWSSP